MQTDTNIFVSIRSSVHMEEAQNMNKFMKNASDIHAALRRELIWLKLLHNQKY